MKCKKIAGQIFPYYNASDTPSEQATTFFFTNLTMTFPPWDEWEI